MTVRTPIESLQNTPTTEYSRAVATITIKHIEIERESKKRVDKLNEAENKARRGISVARTMSSTEHTPFNVCGVYVICLCIRLLHVFFAVHISVLTLISKG